MDTRYTDLRAVCAYEGLSADERSAALDFLDAPVTVAYEVTCLLRGALADRGNLLDNLKAARLLGLSAGRNLLARLLADNSQCQRHPNAVLTEAEWQAGTKANQAAASCDELLRLYLQTRRAIAKRQRAATSAA